jgi:hypothetical protein
MMGKTGNLDSILNITWSIDPFKNYLVGNLFHVNAIIYLSDWSIVCSAYTKFYQYYKFNVGLHNNSNGNTFKLQ